MIGSGIAAEVAAVLQEPEVARKLDLAGRLCARHATARVDPRFERDSPGLPARPASWVVTDARSTGRRPDLATARGRRSLLHAVAHIELSAVELALLAVADFPGEEPAYYGDMLRIAGEEVGHSRLLMTRLGELGGELGEEPVHLGLFETATRFDDLAARLVVVPRVLEAKGLDVSGKLRDALTRAGDAASAAALDRIYQDEIGHVALGTRWHRQVCARRGLDAEAHFLELARPFAPRRRTVIVDRAGRLRAGFTERELDGLAAHAAEASHAVHAARGP